MSDRIETAAEDDDLGTHVSEEALVERAEGAVSGPVLAVSSDEGERVRDEDAALYHSGSEADAVLFAESNKREAAAWRGLIVEKRCLQRAGFGVWFVDKHGAFTGKRGPWIAVGKAIVNHEEFKAWAERDAQGQQAAVGRVGWCAIARYT